MLEYYENFVKSVLSGQSDNTEEFIENLRLLETQGINAAKLMTAANGIGGEGGEFVDCVKKLVFHGEALLSTEDCIKMEKELGDLCFYIMVACIALNVSFYDIIEGNINKLTERYPDGEFNIEHCKTRARD